MKTKKTSNLYDDNIGFIQGRLSPQIDGKIQAFPWPYWQQEFMLAERHGFILMEWTLDYPNLLENPLLTKNGQTEIRALCAQHGIKIPSLTGDCFMQQPFYKAQGQEKTALLGLAQRIIEVCGELGITYIVVPLVDNGSLQSEQQEEDLREELLRLIPVLQDTHCKVIFESDWPAERLLKLISSFDSPWFGINYDIGNSAALGYDPRHEIQTYGQYICNVHVKDRLLKGTTVPLESGAADFSTVFSQLRQIGYAGNYILQTARAQNERHAETLCVYRDKVRAWIQQAETAV